MFCKKRLSLSRPVRLMHFQVQYIRVKINSSVEYDKCYVGNSWRRIAFWREWRTLCLSRNHHHLSHERWEFWGNRFLSGAGYYFASSETIMFSLASSRWIHRGESTTLSLDNSICWVWMAFYSNLSLPTGSQRVSPSRTTLYILTVLNASGLNICTDVVWVSL